ncbi:MAG: monofunctional biosynthetic peptidoglycan transglycosylase [Gammaproteobacteria bacterium]|nr:monofunctional biosynthetic peptidoglycan transglycosylase [Gammaproteobacteria bacterium]
MFRVNRKRLRRWLLCGLVGFVVISLLPVIMLRWVTPPTSAVMLQRTLAEGRYQDYRWVPLDRVSPQAALAVVAAEDQKFPQHWGFDVEAIWNAARRNARGDRLRGASTLTQQVARNLFLWQGRSYLRKGLEAWMTALLELVWPKRRILEVYLNIAEMGEHSFGIEAASRRHFGQSANQLSREQAALIAAILPSPRRYRISNPSAYTSERQVWILEQMELLGGTAYLQEILWQPNRQWLHINTP